MDNLVTVVVIIQVQVAHRPRDHSLRISRMLHLTPLPPITMTLLHLSMSLTSLATSSITSPKKFMLPRAFTLMKLVWKITSMSTMETRRRRKEGFRSYLEDIVVGSQIVTKCLTTTETAKSMNAFTALNRSTRLHVNIVRRGSSIVKT